MNTLLQILENESARFLSDVIALSVLVTIAIYHLLLHIGRRVFRPESGDLAFAGFSITVAIYLFFSNTLQTLMSGNVLSFVDLDFVPTVDISELGSVFALALLGLITQAFLFPLLSVSEKFYLVGIVAGVLLSSFALLCIVGKPIDVGLFRSRLEMPVLVILALYFVCIATICVRGVVRSRPFRSQMNVFLTFLVLGVVLYILLTRTALYMLPWLERINNSWLLVLVVLCVPIIMSARVNREFREWTRLREQLQENTAATGQLLERALAKRSSVSKSQTQVLDRLLKGRAYKEISVELGLSMSAVKKRVHTIYTEFGVQSRTELVALLLE